MSVPHSLAAKLVSGLSGVARRVALHLGSDELVPEQYEYGTDGDVRLRLDYKAMKQCRDPKSHRPP